MKFFPFLKNKKIIIFTLGICVFISIGLHLTNSDFPCLNSDEASFGYNAYSISQSGRDEYGIILPNRFLAFGENKLPVTIYSIVPFIKLLGFSNFSVRLPFILIGIFSPLLFFFLSFFLFKNYKIGLIAALLASFSPWIQILSRHIHEAVIILVLNILSLAFLIRYKDTSRKKDLIYLSFILGVSLFTYHIAKVFFIYYLVSVVIIEFSKKSKNSLKTISKSIIILLIPLLIFGFTELKNPTNRVSNLFFFNNAGFKLSIEQMRSEDGNRLIHNKYLKSLTLLSSQYLSYFSPEFLTQNGDINPRFGYPGISPITPVEYLLFFSGIYFLFHKKDKNRYILLAFLLVSPLSASLSWQGNSITRSFVMIIPIIIFSSYGANSLFESVNHKWGKIFTLTAFASYLIIFTIQSWDFYFFHYPKKVEAIYGWQCGYSELANYLKSKAEDSKKIYITRRLGQPYIFMLFYLKYPPQKYQTQAKLTGLDEYGFGQVEKIDNLYFHFQTPVKNSGNIYVGYPEEFQNTGITVADVKEISINDKSIFWIYEGQLKNIK